jgi:hypothetical protein
MMAASTSDLGLLKAVVEFNDLFYSSSQARYDLTKSGSFRLSPSADQVPALARDYREMQEMFFREPPNFSAILEALPPLEKEINSFK